MFVGQNAAGNEAEKMVTLLTQAAKTNKKKTKREKNEQAAIRRNNLKLPATITVIICYPRMFMTALFSEKAA